MPDNARLVSAAVNLRGMSARDWDEFVSAMREYSATVTAEMLRCPTEQLPRAQGMALMVNEIASVLHDAPRLHEKHREARMRQENGRRQQSPT